VFILRMSFRFRICLWVVKWARNWIEKNKEMNCY
jgi:hypothetical protein